MSQTSLASAIRRRTKNDIVAKTTQGNIPIPPHKKTNLNNQSNQQTNQNSTNPSQKVPSSITISDTQVTSPLMLLLQHKQLINQLHNDIADLKEEVNLINQTNQMNQKTTDPNDVAYYKKQYETLLNEFSELKKVLVKVQTFSMETNLEMLQLKRLLKTSQVEQTEQIDIQEINEDIEENEMNEVNEEDLEQND
jgi:hypothetical protein